MSDPSTHITPATSKTAPIAMRRKVRIDGARWRSARADGLRRSRQGWASLLVATLLVSAACQLGDQTRPDPNVILIVIDTLRADHLSGYGYYRNTTPKLDAFIQEGVRFDSAIATGSWSPPSQISIITGVNPYLHGVNDFGQRIRDEIDPLGSLLKKQGYTTGLFSSHRALHHGVERSTEGMSTQFVELDRDRRILAAAAAFAQSAKSPFFLYICLTTPHAPYDRYPEDYNTRFFTEPPDGGGQVFPFTDVMHLGIDAIPKSVRIGDHDDLGFYVNRYDRSIRFVDQLVGKFWNALEESGVASNTLLVVTSDHGEGLGDNGVFAHEYFLYDFLVRVPLILHFPDRIRGGQIWSQQVSLLDIVPTVLGLTGASIPETLEGRDLSNHLVAGTRPTNAPLVSGSYIARGHRRFMVRAQRHKLILDANTNEEKFYDLLTDPTEQVDLTDSDDNAVRTAEYARLQQEMTKTIGRYQIPETGQTPIELSPQLIEDLRKMGYIE
jgi:arylsulfatase A-like enzyme